jgi:hypothetical protein
MNNFEIKTLHQSAQKESIISINNIANKVIMDYSFNDIRFIEEDEFPFFALVKIRKKLEELGMYLLCEGSNKYVYPSGMSAITYKAYRLYLGKPANKLVNIFDPIEDILNVASVSDQKAYRDEWLKSLQQDN